MIFTTYSFKQIRVVILACLFLISFNAFSAERVALVIGNSNYTELGVLKNTINDAEVINKLLVEIGYKTTLVLNASESTVRKSVRKFSEDSESANIAVVFYAGHGAQVFGENYLLPVDIEIPKRESDIQLSAVKVDDIINSIKSRNKIIFLDACRDNPALIRTLAKGRGSYRGGLAPASSSSFSDGSGIFIAYATDSGNVALDGDGQKNSPFTSALIKYAKEPISIDDMFSKVTKDVRQSTKNTQKPYKYASLEGIVCLPGSCTRILEQPSPTQIKSIANPTESPSNLNALPSNWALSNVAIGTKTLISIKPDSIKRDKDRVWYETKWLKEDGTYLITGYVMSCSSKFAQVYSSAEYDASGKKISDYLFGDPLIMALKVDYSDRKSIGYSLISLTCDPEKYTPLIQSNAELTSSEWTRFYSLPIGDMAYLKKSINKNKSTVTVISKVTFEKMRVAEMKDKTGLSNGYENFSNTPYVKTLVSRNVINCSNKTSYQNLENLYDEEGNLIVYMSYQSDESLASKNSPESPMEQFVELMCH